MAKSHKSALLNYFTKTSGGSIIYANVAKTMICRMMKNMLLKYVPSPVQTKAAHP